MNLEQLITMLTERFRQQHAALIKCRQAEGIAEEKFEETARILNYFRNHGEKEKKVNGILNRGHLTAAILLGVVNDS